FVAEIRAPLPRHDGGADRIVRRIHAHRAVTDVDERSQVTFFEAVRAEHLAARGHDLLAREARCHQRELARIEEPIDVLPQAEDVALTVFSLVTTDTFE